MPAAHILAKAGFVFSEDKLLWLDKMRTGEANKILSAMASRENLVSYKEFASLKISTDLLTDFANDLLNQKEFHAFIVMMKKIMEIDKSIISPTLYIWMARYGYIFTMNEIREMHNIAGKYDGATIAHYMAKNGWRFTVSEITELGNPKSSFYPLNIIDDFQFHSFPEDYKKNNSLGHDGATIAHIMAREGYQFTPEEIDTLGNPMDADGKTISDWVEIFKNKRDFVDHTPDTKLNSADQADFMQATKPTH